MTKKEMETIISRCRTSTHGALYFMVWILLMQGCFKTNLSKQDVEDVLRENGLIPTQTETESNV